MTQTHSHTYSHSHFRTNSYILNSQLARTHHCSSPVEPAQNTTRSPITNQYSIWEPNNFPIPQSYCQSQPSILNTIIMATQQAPSVMNDHRTNKAYVCVSHFILSRNDPDHPLMIPSLGIFCDQRSKAGTYPKHWGSQHLR